MGGHKIFVAEMGGGGCSFIDADFLQIWDPPSEENASLLKSVFSDIVM